MFEGFDNGCGTQTGMSVDLENRTGLERKFERELVVLRRFADPGDHPSPPSICRLHGGGFAG